MSGVTVGEESIIGAEALVAKNISPYCIAVVCPTKSIIFFEQRTKQ